MARIDQLRTQLGESARNKTDEELLSLVARATNQSEAEVASRYNYRPTGSGTTGLRFGAAIDRYQAGLYGLGEAITGSDTLRRRREANEFQAAVASQRAQAQGAVDRFSDVRSLRDFGSYLGGLAIQSSPYIAETLGGGLAARAAMSGTRAALRGGIAAGDAAQAGRAATTLRRGQLGGAVAASYPSAVGEILQAQREQTGDEVDLASASALGVPFAGLNVLGFEGRVLGGQGVRSGVRRLDEMTGLTGGLTRAGVTGLRVGATEAVAEVGQEALQDLGRMAVDPQAEFWDDSAPERYFEAAAGGFFLGKTLGAGAGGWRRTELTPQEQAEQQLQSLHEQARILREQQSREADLTQPVDTDLEIGLGIIPPTNPYDVGGFVSRFQEGGETGIEGQGGLFGAVAPTTEMQADMDALGAAPAAAQTQAAGPVQRDPRALFLRDTLGVVPTAPALQLMDAIEQSGIPVDSDILSPVITYAAQRPMTPKRLERAVQLLDEAIITARRDAAAAQQAVAPVVSTPGVVSESAGALPAAAPAVAGLSQEAQVETQPTQVPAAPVVETAPVAEAQQQTAAPTPQVVETTPEVDPRISALATIFGDRNANIMFDVMGMGMPLEQAAQKYNMSTSNVGKIAGMERDAVSRRAKQIERAAARGVDVGAVERAFTSMIQESAEQRAQSIEAGGMQNMFDIAAATEQEAEAAGLEGRIDTAGGSESNIAAKVTQSEQRMMEVLEALAAETDPQVVAELQAELDTFVRRAEAENRRNQEEVRRTAGRQTEVATEGEVDAVQEQTTAEVPVQPEARGRQKTGRQVRRAQEPAAEGQVQTTQEKYAQVVSAVPGAPAFADLTRAQQDQITDLANRDQLNLAAVNRVVGETRTKFGREEGRISGPNVQNPYTAADLRQELQDFVRGVAPSRKLVIVDNVQELINSRDPQLREIGVELALDGNELAYGVARGGRAVLVANRIRQGYGRAKFMHEVGTHLGLKNLLPDAQFESLADQVVDWADGPADTTEGQLARKALARVPESTPNVDLKEEVVAYFIEEAIQANINPTAAADTTLSGPLRTWFRNLWAAFKTAIRRLGVNPETLTAQDYVNLAYGAARLEVAGTWHGTAADFRRFDHSYMGTGEGAQAFGWGTYLAQRFGIARGYWQADVKRKKGAPSSVLFGMAAEDLRNASPKQKEMIKNFAERVRLVDRAKFTKEKAGDDIASVYRNFGLKGVATYSNLHHMFFNHVRELVTERGMSVSDAVDLALDFTLGRTNIAGSLMRVDTVVPQNEMLDWDKPLSKQRNILTKVETGMSESLLAEIQEEANADLKDMTGEEVYRALEFLEHRDGRVSEEFEVADYNKRLRNAKARKIVSTYMDEKLGIGGLQFLDAESRGNRLIVQWSNQQNNWRVIKRSDGAVLHTSENEADARAWAEKNGKPKFQTRNLVIFNDKNIFRVGTRVAADAERMKFGKEQRQGINEATTRQSTAERVKNLNRIPEPARGPARAIANAFEDIGGRFLDMAMFTDDLINRAVKVGLPSAERLKRTLAARDFMAREEERSVESILNTYANLPQNERGLGDGSVNRFIFDSTRTGKWGYGDRADAATAKRFEALSPQSKKLVQDIFAHGERMLQRKKDIVLNNTRSEFDAQIANEPTAKGKAELRKAKQLALKRYESLFNVREGRPYAPIKRTGDYVVIAKSKEYMAAEKANDKKAMERLEADGDHYHVSFVDGKNAGRTLRQQLETQGAFADVQLAQRDVVTDELFSNQDALQQLTKLRSNVDARVKAGETEAAKMLSIINQMYLEALAEGSARKSEMKRRGVDGEVDMIASFATQGRADANFLASLQYADQVSDVLNAARAEAKTGDRTRKSEVLNELSKRYADSLEVPNNPWINKLTRLSSVYFLASSPGYYMQNLTQPFMMSVPAMAGRFNYLKVNSELYKAYTELGPIMKSAKLFSQQLDYSKVPQDVKLAINELVNRGRIDIGLETELGEFQVDGKTRFGAAWNRVDKGLRMAVQKGEAVNRLSTAIAAYRLAKAEKGSTHEGAVDYAERILMETHGDYSRFNAPRVFNTPVGKVALQFRKFQLIQLSWYGRMIRDAIADPTQRAVALKSLAFGLAHTGVLAGAMGLPGYYAVAWFLSVLSSFMGDEEGFDLTDEIRKSIGDPTIADMVLRGVPTLGGADWSGKIGAGNMISVMPFSNADLTTRSGFYEALGTMVGGASAGMVVRGVDGLGLLANGDYVKGMELMLPKGLGDMIKAYRFGTDGVTRRNNDIILPESELSALELMWQAVGIPPAQLTSMYERQQRVRTVEQRLQSRSTRIRNDYVQAIRKGDNAAAAKARADWQSLQDARARVGLNRQPLSNLLRAPREQARRERDTAGGIQFTRASRGMVEDITER